MKVLITGVAGYIGTTLLAKIMNETNWEVVGLDRLLYGGGALIPFISNQRFTFIKGDVRDEDNVKKALAGCDAVIHLAAISNDPLGEIKENITNQINRDATVRIAELSKSNNVKRFIFFSSQSMYGISKTSNELDEYDSEKNPITAYARTKYEAEKMIIKPKTLITMVTNVETTMPASRNIASFDFILATT